MGPPGTSVWLGRAGQAQSTGRERSEQLSAAWAELPAAAARVKSGSWEQESAHHLHAHLSSTHSSEMKV